MSVDQLIPERKPRQEPEQPPLFDTAQVSLREDHEDPKLRPDNPFLGEPGETYDQPSQYRTLCFNCGQNIPQGTKRFHIRRSKARVKEIRCPACGAAWMRRWQELHGQQVTF